MDRRSFLALTGAALVVPGMSAAKALDYRPGLVTERLAAGETVFLDFKASWCSTCRTQGRAITALKSENPAYEQNVTFIDVDWDSYGKSELARSLNVPRRSTLIVLKGEDEIGRIVAQTGKSTIKSLMDAALQAATA